MPNRLLKEGIVDSSLIDNLSPEEEVFFYRLLVVSDDFGRMDARTAILKSRCFPLKEFKSEKIDNWLQSLVRHGLVMLYKVDDKPYLQILKWEQRVRSKGKYPDPDGGQPIGIVQTFDSNPLTDDGLGKGLGKGKGMGNGGSKASRLSTDFELPNEWIEFCKTERPDLNPQATFLEFKDYWIAKAGKDGCKTDWLATWRNWVRRSFSKTVVSQTGQDKSWQFSNEGIVAKANELGLRSEGLSYQQLKDKCLYVMTNKALQ